MRLMKLYNYNILLYTAAIIEHKTTGILSYSANDAVDCTL